MIIPAAMNIESAADSMRTLDPRIVEDQLQELDSFGATRLQSLGMTGLSDDVRLAYTLGLQVARTVVASSAEALIHGADPAKIL